MRMKPESTFGDFILGFEGLGILRSWMLDPAAVRAGRDRILRILQEIEQEPWSNPMSAEQKPASEGYAEWASSYDKPGNPILAAEQPVVQMLLADRPVGTALDAACGTGRHAACLDALGHTVIGIDAVSEMLDVARAKVPNARFETAELTSIPLPDEIVDLAVCGLALTHFQELDSPVRELARVVRTGGSIIISEVHPFVVMLGGHSGYSVNQSEKAFVRNYVHLASSYLNAFRRTNLKVLRCVEPLWGDEDDTLPSFAKEMPELAAAAIKGVPAAVVWELEKNG